MIFSIEHLRTTSYDFIHPLTHSYPNPDFTQSTLNPLGTRRGVNARRTICYQSQLVVGNRESSFLGRTQEAKTFEIPYVLAGRSCRRRRTRIGPPRMNGSSVDIDVPQSIGHASSLVLQAVNGTQQLQLVHVVPKRGSGFRRF